MIVVGKLVELRVLHDLQHPDAHGEHREYGRDQVLQDRQPNARPPPFLVLGHFLKSSNPQILTSH
jgi:hypothetical protein